MPSKDLGAKHTCFKCGAKFYDMKKPAAICPKCGADQKDSPALKSPPPSERRSRASRAAAPVEPVEADESADTEAELDEELEDDDADVDGDDADEP